MAATDSPESVDATDETKLAEKAAKQEPVQPRTDIKIEILRKLRTLYIIIQHAGSGGLHYFHILVFFFSWHFYISSYISGEEFYRISCLVQNIEIFAIDPTKLGRTLHH